MVRKQSQKSKEIIDAPGLEILPSVEQLTENSFDLGEFTEDDYKTGFKLISELDTFKDSRMTIEDVTSCKWGFKPEYNVKLLNFGIQYNNRMYFYLYIPTTDQKIFNKYATEPDRDNER